MRSNKDDDGGQSKAMAVRWKKERKEGKEGRKDSNQAGWLAQYCLTSVIEQGRAISENRFEGKQGEEKTTSKIATLDSSGDQSGHM